MEIIGAFLFIIFGLTLLYFTVKAEKKQRKKYFEELNKCIFDSLDRAFKNNNI